MINHKIKALVIGLLITMLGGCKVINPSYVDDDIGKKYNNILTIDGSTSMTKLCNSLGEVFMSQYPGTSVEKLDTGSSASVESVIDGSSQIGALSRKLNNREPIDKLNVIKIADDGICIIVNKDNAVNDLSKEEIYQIFTKSITNWKELNGKDEKIVLIGREEASGTKDGFEESFNLVGKCKYDAIFSESGDILSQVGSDENSIGYVSMASKSDNVKIVSIDGIEPTFDNIEKGIYPVVRPFIMIYMNNNRNPLISKWFDFVFSEKGKEIIKKEGFIVKGDAYE